MHFRSIAKFCTSLHLRGQERGVAKGYTKNWTMVAKAVSHRNNGLADLPILESTVEIQLGYLWWTFGIYLSIYKTGATLSATKGVLHD